jgi:Flp pilus assembly protein TadB
LILDSQRNDRSSVRTSSIEKSNNGAAAFAHDRKEREREREREREKERERERGLGRDRPAVLRVSAYATRVAEGKGPRLFAQRCSAICFGFVFAVPILTSATKLRAPFREEGRMIPPMIATMQGCRDAGARERVEKRPRDVTFLFPAF